MLSVIIPARNEQFLQATINDLLKNARDEIEIIAVLEGYWPDPPLQDDKRVIIIHNSLSNGMRTAINQGVAIARGEWIMKTDAHCMFDDGFDIKLIADCEPNWVVVPRRKRLDAENWCIQDVGKPDIDQEYICYPENEMDYGGAGLNGKIWPERSLQRLDILIDDDMTMQGSCWFMARDYFYELELMDRDNYGEFWNEAQEISMKAWLSGGKVVRNKKTWYAHLHKGKKYGRGYFLDEKWLKQGRNFMNGWMVYGENWHKQTKPLSWLIERFYPVPTWSKKKIEELKARGN